jgi:hypothetical protein
MFGFYKDDNPGLADNIIGKIDQVTSKITVYAPVGSGATTWTMYPRFTAAGQVNVAGTPQASGVSGRLFDSPLPYTVVSANGKNTRTYMVTVRELQTTIYVKHDANGMNDGMSWNDAFISLKAACDAAAEFPQDVPKEIWIARGTYTPGNKAGDYFPLTANTSYMGGFAGTETAKSQRNVTANTVTISGGGITRTQPLFYGGSIINNLPGDLLFEDLQLKDIRGSGIQVYNRGGNVEINNLNLQDISGCCLDFRGSPNRVQLSNIIANNVGGDSSIIFQGVQNELIIKDSSFTNCTGVSLSAPTSARIEGSNVGFNNITSNAALSINNGNVTIDNVNIDGVPNGRGIYVSSNNTVLISNSTIKNCNLSNGNGAGIYINGAGYKEISGTTLISGNTSSSGSGGGVYVQYGTFTMNGGTISGNTAKTDGGGMRLANVDFIMNNGSISNNIVQGGASSATGGGGVSSRGGTFTMTGGTISGNTSDLDAPLGGGVLCYSSKFIMTGGTISGNNAVAGGGVYVYAGGATGNFLKTGGTIYGSGEGVNSNTASYYGNAVAGGANIETTLGPSDNFSW